MAEFQVELETVWDDGTIVGKTCPSEQYNELEADRVHSDANPLHMV